MRRAAARGREGVRQPAVRQLGNWATREKKHIFQKWILRVRTALVAKYGWIYEVTGRGPTP
jgi:hypothetical protein